jgi:sec-independent protein translocase protein TatC
MARLLRRGPRYANPEGRMSVIDHLRELRRRLIIVMLIISAGAILGYVFYDPIITFLKHPYCNVNYHHRFAATSQSDCNLQFRDPLGGFTIRLKVAFITGALITAPFWLYQIWAFVTPGLRRNERKWTIAFILSSSLLFIAGMALAYVTLAKGLDVLITSAGSGVQANLDVTSYISFVSLMLIIFGAAFEVPLLIVMLNGARVLPFSVLKRGQRIGIFLVFLFAAVATPSPDPFTMIAMALPMVVLFEASVLWAYIHDRRLARRERAEEAQQLPDDVASEISPFPERLPETTPQFQHSESEWKDIP